MTLPPFETVSGFERCSMDSINSIQGDTFLEKENFRARSIYRGIRRIIKTSDGITSFARVKRGMEGGEEEESGK